MDRSSKTFYLFLGFHSFLLGLFPFFLPVYLFKSGANLSDVSWFICCTGIGFTITLWLWDHLRTDSFLLSITCSFILEIGLLFLVVQGAPLPLLALVNGMYSCLYWTIQRVLFFDGGNSDSSGRRFGNVQIFVLIVLKIGIILGSLLLENSGLLSVFLLSVFVGAMGIILFFSLSGSVQLPFALQQQKPVSFPEIVTFSDTCNSRVIFIVDGVFLYLESYFWLISLFIIVGQSFTRLGILVVFLALFLALLFYFIKNRIDHADRQRMYIFSVVLYTLSWGLRAGLTDGLNYTVQICFILLIAFCTSFFRLAFNKRFFDTAQKGTGYHYLFIKSYYSQISITIIFGFLAWAIAERGSVEMVLRSCYLSAALFAAVYLFFKPVSDSDSIGNCVKETESSHCKNGKVRYNQES